MLRCWKKKYFLNKLMSFVTIFSLMVLRSLANCCFVRLREKMALQAQLQKHYPQDHKAEEKTEDIYFEQLIALKNGRSAARW
jgi:hypothetical protein